MTADCDDKVEGEVGQVLYTFVLNHGSSRWLIEMEPSHGPKNLLAKAAN